MLIILNVRFLIRLRQAILIKFLSIAVFFDKKVTPLFSNLACQGHIFYSLHENH
jgi:hypothetical protein